MHKNTLVPQAMPSFLTTYPDLMGRLSGTSAFTSSPHQRPNHVIMNEYLPGQGIMPHEDGPSYHPVVATISLGSHAASASNSSVAGKKILLCAPNNHQDIQD